jgi:hypothetical protein
VAGLYATLHAPEVVYFYGLRAQRAQTSADPIRVDSLRDPAPRKASRGRIFAIVVGVFLLFGMLAIGAGYAWWQTQGPELLAEGQAETAAGTEFGDSTDDQGCLAEVLERFDRCGGGFSCNIRTNLFFGACLEASSRSDGFCDGVPSKDSFMESVGWGTALCEQYGRSGSYCGSFFQRFQEHCHPQEAE